MNIGFIGLGGMGRAMAANLLKAGYKVRVWNRSPGPVAELQALGAEAARDCAEVFGADVVLSMLADDNAVRAAIIEAEVLRAAPRHLVHANMATVSVALTRELQRLHAGHGSSYVAAPVFGRPDAAAAARLNIVAAGPAPALQQLQPLFDAIGQKTWPMGSEPEQAVAVKLGGNFMIAAAVEAMAEAAALGAGFGVAPRDLITLMSSTLFAAPVYQNYGALIAEQRYDPAAFRLQLGLKDVNLALAASQEAAAPMPFAGVLRDNLLDAIAHGDGDRDWAALAEVAFRRARAGRGGAAT